MNWLYYRFVYRRLMKLAHRYGWHHTRACYPDGDTMEWCEWCGLRYVRHRRGVEEIAGLLASLSEPRTSEKEPLA